MPDDIKRIQEVEGHLENIEAEQGLLGLILTDNLVVEEMGNIDLRTEHFADADHQIIHAAVMKLIDHGQLASATTLARYFSNEPRLQNVGGAEYLAKLIAAPVVRRNAAAYAAEIKDCYTRRQLLRLARFVEEQVRGADVDTTAEDIIETTESSLYSLVTEGIYDGGFMSASKVALAAVRAAEAAHKRAGALAGVTTGLHDLDALLGGLHPTDLIILAGRPSMGKSSLATNIAVNAARRHLETNGAEGAGVGFFSLEMSGEQLGIRIMSEMAEIPSDKVRKGQVSNEDFPRYVQASQELSNLPLWIDDTPGLSMSAIRTRARRLKRKHNIGLIVIDYLQLIMGLRKTNADGRVQEVSEITRQMKILAKELGVPVIGLSQLSREVEKRDPPRPQLSDLRDSGSIEQDADVVIFVYREEYYMERKKPSRRADEDESKLAERLEKWEIALDDVRNIAEAIVAKQRHGPIGTVPMHFDGPFTRFGDLDKSHGYWSRHQE